MATDTSRANEFRILTDTLSAMVSLEDKLSAYSDAHHANYPGDWMEEPVRRTASTVVPEVEVLFAQATWTGRLVLGSCAWLLFAGFVALIMETLHAVVLGATLLAFSILAWPVYVFLGGLFGWGDKLDAPRIKRAKDSDSYKLACRNAAIEASQLQAKYDKEYRDAVDTYTRVHLEQVAAKNAWRQSQDEAIESLERSIQSDKDLLAELNSSNVIPMTYRNLTALAFIKETMETSTYTLKEACNLYETRKSQQLEQERIRAQNEANAIARDQLAAQDEANSIADQARREARLAAGVAAIQRHNTNKYLKSRR